jgi:hypothetical protein
MGGKDNYVSRNVRGKQPSESEESYKVDRTRRHAQNGHEEPVECMLWPLVWRTFSFYCRHICD